MKIALDDVEAINLSAERAADLIDLDDALTALAAFDPQKKPDGGVALFRGAVGRRNRQSAGHQQRDICAPMEDDQSLVVPRDYKEISND